jgi:hypothetical protein
MIHVATRSQAGRSGVRVPIGARKFSLLQKVQTASGTHTASYSMGSMVNFQEKSGQGVTFTTDLNVVPGLRMSGAIPLLPLYAFMARTGK